MENRLYLNLSRLRASPSRPFEAQGNLRAGIRAGVVHSTITNFFRQTWKKGDWEVSRSPAMTYQGAGVDIERAVQSLAGITNQFRRTWTRPQGEIGSVRLDFGL